MKKILYLMAVAVAIGGVFIPMLSFGQTSVHNKSGCDVDTFGIAYELEEQCWKPQGDGYILYDNFEIESGRIKSRHLYIDSLGVAHDLDEQGEQPHKDMPHCTFFLIQDIRHTTSSSGVSATTTTNSIPMLKTAHRIYVNAFYDRSKLRDGFNPKEVNEYVNAAIRDFKKEHKKYLSKKTMKKVEERFRRGVVYSYFHARYF